MKKILLKCFKKIFVKQWVIGLCHGDIKAIIRSKNFDPVINWLPLESLDHFYADPFLLRGTDGNLNIFYEDFSFDDFYGKISVMEFDKNFNLVSKKILLDTKSHLSYPFIYKENDIIYIFPEAGHSGKLSCYKYDPILQSLNFLQDIIDLPILDCTILKHNGKYWLFGTLIGEDSDKKLNIYFSDTLLGTYTSHPGNPVKNSLTGSRPAGNFIEVDGAIYRPSQNSENQYGESITINKINILNELNYVEEPHMVISINRNRSTNHNLYTIHTINVLDDIITVDGLRWTFSPKNQWKNFLRNIAYERRRKIRKEEKFIQSDKF